MALRTAIVAVAACWLVAASFMVVLSPQATRLMASATVAPGHVLYSREELIEAAEATRAFVTGDREVVLVASADERAGFTAEAISHLLDVRKVFSGAVVFFGATGVLLLTLCVYGALLDRRKEIGGALVVGSLVPLALGGAVLVVGVLWFEQLFSALHGVFFAAGTWQFSYDSLLISALPQGFWMGCGLLWAVSLALFCAAGVILGLIIRRPKWRDGQGA
ncbi:MAG: DUF1461 domain-containing protein [Coriobacteriales bacterium]|jgi:integral membrane protein (TIGR01906 family)|nr:DUF1461 domain-containing protein [Coriobacteriales bacterium]